MATPIERILETESAYSHYQPILSIKRRQVVGYEALGRGQDPDSGGVFPPTLLFDMADLNQRRRLNHLFKRRGIEGFKDLQVGEPKPLLFLNCDVKSLDPGGCNPEVLQAWLRSGALEPREVVLEMVESVAPNVELLKSFVENHRHAGFLISLDDVGTGYSNLDRIHLLQPDIIKIDRSLVSYLDQNFHQQEVFRALVQLARHIGALVVAEGVERREEALACLEWGADMLQGYYFSPPQKPTREHEPHLKSLLEGVTKEYREKRLAHEKGRLSRQSTYNQLGAILSSKLTKSKREKFGQVLDKFIERNPFTEAVYILDETGIQVTDVVTNPVFMPPVPRLLFQSPPVGTDHSMKDYFYVPMATEMHRYVSDPYVSLATGRRCITLTTPFQDANGSPYLLCMDLRADP
jgi:EAL domain-containing protein (putative c-di-GMP-specific phosphodiesterase class I)